MSNLEKLFVQIFERKNWIVEQVKQQRDLFDQHGASKLIINGIRPPSWLLNAGFETGGVDLKDLKKEELITSLLVPPPRPLIPSSSGHCILYDRPTVTLNNGEVSSSFCMDTCASNKYFDAGDMLAVEPKCRLENIEPPHKATSEALPEEDPTVASPKDQTDARISDTDLEPGQSLVRIQRSRSRQKALELRNSKDAKLKKHQCDKNSGDLYSGRITRSKRAHQQSNCFKELLESDNSFDITRKSCGDVEAKAEDCLSKENCTSVNPGRVSVSRTSSIRTGCMKEFSESKSLSNVSREGDGKIGSSKPPSQQRACDANFQKDLDSEVTVKSSISGQKDLVICDSVEKNLEMHPNKGDNSDAYVVRNRRLQTTPQQLNWAEELLIPDNSSKIPSGRITQPRSSSVNRFSSLVESSNRDEGHDIQETLNTQLNDLGNVVNDNVDQERCTCVAAEAEQVPNGRIAAFSVQSGSNMVGAGPGGGLEFLVRMPPPDSSMFVEPKQLVFDDVEECDETIHPAFEKLMQAGPSEIKSFTSLGPFESLKKVACLDPPVKHISSVEGDFVEEQGVEIVNKEKEAWRDPSEVQAEERPEYVKVESSKCDSYSTPSAGKDFSAISLRGGTSKVSKGAASNTSLETNEILNLSPSLVDRLNVLPVGRKSSSGNQVRVVNYNLPDVDADTGLDSLGEKHGIKLNVGHGEIFSVDAKLETYASDSHKISSIHDNSNASESRLFRNPTVLLGAQDNELSLVSTHATKGGLATQTVIPGTAQIHSAEQNSQYFLKSSISHDKSACSSKSSESLIVMMSEELINNASESSWSQSKRRKIDGRPPNIFTSRKSVQSEETINNASESSWPQYKRRKIEVRPTNVFTASRRLSCIKQFQKIHEVNICRELKSVEDRSDTGINSRNFPSSHGVEVAQPNAFDLRDLEMHWSEKLYEIQKCESSPKLQAEEVELNLEGEDQGANEESQGCLKEEARMEDPTTMILDVRRPYDAGHNQDMLYHESKCILESMENMVYTEETMQEGSSHLQEHNLFSHYSVISPCHEDLNLVCADQTISEFENFSKHVPKEKELPCIARDGISSDKSDNPSSIEQGSVFEQLFKSASLLTPLSPFSVKYKLHKTPDIYQSLPNGLLEHMDLRNALLFNDDDRKQLKASYSFTRKEINCTSLARSYSDSMPSSNLRFGSDTRRPYTPPVGKLCQRITSKSTGGSSEKQDCVNPELICFRIEEDSSPSEENEDIDEVADSSEEGISSRDASSSTNREPLVDMTSKYLNPSAFVSAAEKSLDRGSLDSVNMEINIPGRQTLVRQKLRYGYGGYGRDRNMDKENGSLGENGMQKVTRSLHNRFSKPKLSEKASERKGGQSLLEKGLKRNNIVSNVSSFIPLVQQNQARPVLTGKRDIKVKALEAAEAAKRLEEKRENERKMKKEAAKLERARLEQENFRQLELKQKKKEEERKKKEADMAARKRRTEEEEKKEKGKKRKCIEEAWRQKSKHDEKLCSEKKEKELRIRAADERELKRKELTGEARKHQKMEIGGEEAKCRKNVETESRASNVLTDNVKRLNNPCEDNEFFEEPDDIEKVAYNLGKANEDGNSSTEGNREQSYDMSPYQSSDDEEEEDEIPNKKFIPSWASKNNVALVLLSLQKMDPYKIFPQTSFCNIAEVLLPRKQQLK